MGVVLQIPTPLVQSPEVVRAGIAALCSGGPILVDVKMIGAGLNEERLASCGCTIRLFISDEDVIATAKSTNTTRAIEAMRKAERLGILEGAIVAIGNARPRSSMSCASHTRRALGPRSSSACRSASSRPPNPRARALGPLHYAGGRDPFGWLAAQPR